MIPPAPGAVVGPRLPVSEIRAAVDRFLDELAIDAVRPDEGFAAALERWRSDPRRSVVALVARVDRRLSRLAAERERLEAMLAPERAVNAAGYRRVAGVDEAGRGPLAGPVVAGAVILPPGFLLPGVDDSKRLTEAEREALYERIRSTPGARVAVGLVAPHVIDRINILNATHLAMRQAVEGLDPRPDHALVDGLPVRGLPVPHTALVGGDGLSHSIACASIVAKVTRDRLMKRLARRFPHWGFEIHKGYGTPDHLAAIRRHGPSPIHRRSFRGATGS